MSNKIKELLRKKPKSPTNGLTHKPYRKSNEFNLNESFILNEYKYNIWLSEKQCEKIGTQIIDRNPSIVIDRFGNQTEVYNISQTNYLKSTQRKKVISSKPTQTERIEKLEDLINGLMTKLSEIESKVTLQLQ